MFIYEPYILIIVIHTIHQKIVSLLDLYFYTVFIYMCCPLCPQRPTSFLNYRYESKCNLRIRWLARSICRVVQP